MGIWLRHRPGETEAAVMRDGWLVDHALWRPDAPDGVGDLQIARAGRHDRLLGGTFVVLAAPNGGAADAFLPDREAGPDGTPGEGRAVAVRVERAAQGGKGARVTARLSPDEVDAAARATGGPLPRLVRRAADPVARLLARWPTATVTVPHPALAASLSPRAVRIDPATDHETASALDALRGPEAALPGGARATFHPTPALVAVDVDTAACRVTAGGGRDAAMLAVNRALLPRLVDEIRLRALAGAIVVDLAGLAARKRRLLGPDFARALATDPLGARFLGITALGLAEIVRARREAPLHERVATPLARAIDAAAALAAHASAPGHAGRFALRVAPALAPFLAAGTAVAADLAAATGQALLLRTDPARATGFWAVEERNVTE